MLNWAKLERIKKYWRALAGIEILNRGSATITYNAFIRPHKRFIDACLKHINTYNLQRNVYSKAKRTNCYKYFLKGLTKWWNI